MPLFQADVFTTNVLSFSLQLIFGKLIKRGKASILIFLVFDNFSISRMRNKFILSCQAHLFTFWEEDGRHLLSLSLLGTERWEFKTCIRYYMGKQERIYFINHFKYL